jgi:integral membrane sensor domain MASE1
MRTLDTALAPWRPLAPSCARLVYNGSAPRTQQIRRFPNPSLVWNSVRTSNSLRRIVGLILVYFLVCKLGLRLAIVHPSATAVWPGIFLGAFAVNLTTAGSIASLLGIASGNTLEAVLGAYLIIRFANGRNVFNRAEGIFKFFLFCVHCCYDRKCQCWNGEPRSHRL